MTRRSSLGLALALVVTGAIFAIGMTRAPQRLDDEGTYTSQAYAVGEFGELAHYTYWYDHPPLGWIQIAAWTWATDAFDRYSTAVSASREAMLVAYAVSAVLLWLLARRVGLSRGAAAGAVLIFGVSPLSLMFHRTAYLDNVATPWMLAAFVLAHVRQRQLIAFGGSGVCMAVAVLSKETYVLVVPVLAWLLWRNAHPELRRYTLSVAGSLFCLVGLGYALFALVKGELLPGDDHVSLWDGISFQLFGREGSSLFEAGSQTRRVVAIWWSLDPVLCVVSLVAATACLFDRSLRPFAVLLLGLGVFMLRPGYLPIPYVVALLPLAALLVAGAADAALRQRISRVRVGGAAAAVVAVAVAAPLWSQELRGLLTGEADQPLRSAQEWIEQNVPRDRRLIVDDSLWVDLVRAGFPRANAVWFYKVDTDQAVFDLADEGWRDYDFVVVTKSVLESQGTGRHPQVDTALHNSTPVARFGRGDDAVEVRLIDPAGTEQAWIRARQDRDAAAAAGVALAANPHLQLSTPAHELLVAGQVDQRVITILALLVQRHELSVTAFPATTGELPTAVRRSVVVGRVAGLPVALADPALEQVASRIRQQPDPYTTDDIVVSDGRLEITYPAPTPSGLLPLMSLQESSAPESQVGTGWIRSAHLSPGTAAVDVYLRSVTGNLPPIVAANVGYGNASPYQPVPVGTYTATVVPAGAGAGTPPILVTAARVEAGRAYTIAGLGAEDHLVGRVLSDDVTSPPAGTARVRLIQGSSEAPVVDVTAARGEAIAEEAGFATSTGYAIVPAGRWTLRVQPREGSARPVISTVELPPDSVSSLLVLDAGGGKGIEVHAVVDSEGGAVTR